MIEDDGGFMRRETKREPMFTHDNYCEECGKVLDDNDDVVYTDFDNFGLAFCSQGCREERRMAECEAREFMRYEYDYLD